MISHIKKFLKNRIAFKILIAIFLLGSFISISTTVAQLYFDSKNNLKEAKQSIGIIKKTSIEAISLSLYNFNISQLEVQLASLLNLPGIQYLRITDNIGFELSAGSFDQSWENIIKETVNIEYTDVSKQLINLGQLEIIAKPHNLYISIYETLPILMFTNFIKALIMGILIFVLVHFLITRHLRSIVNYASNVNMNKLDTPLYLERKPSLFIKKDELDQLIDALNNMRLRLKQDIEKQSKYETRLVRSEERLRQLVNATRDAVVVHENGIIIFANAQFYNMLGYEPEELKNINIITKVMIPESSEFSQKMVASQKLDHYEVTGLKKDSTTFAAEIHTKVMEFHGKDVRVASIRDISDYKKTQEEIAKLRNFLKSIIDSMPSFIAGVDIEGKITEWNNEAGKLTGYPAEEALGKPMKDMLPKMDIDINLLRKTVLAQNIEKIPKVTVFLDKEEHIFDITIYPLGHGFEGAAIRADDITEKIRMEEMLIQSEKMLSVGGLAAGMAHEINNPLAGVLQNLQVIENRLKRNLKKNNDAALECGITMDAMQNYMKKREIFTLMESISQSGKRAATIVRDMLSFARKSDSIFTKHDIIEIMASTLELAEKEYNLKKKFDFKKIKIIKNYDKIPSILCDKNKIKQVLLNVLKNGAQAMAEVSDTETQPGFALRIFQKKNMVRIEIQDNGPGIERKLQKKIFEPFFTTKPIGIGTGLGLSVSYFIICENHRGKMGVTSSKGNGATFYIELPIT